MLDLGSLQFGLAIDTRALNAAEARIKAFGASVTAVQAAANRGSDNQIAQYRKQENAILSGTEKLKNAINQIANLKIAPTIKVDLIQQANRAYNDLSKTVASAGKAIDNTKFDRGIASFNASLNNLRRAASNMPKLGTDNTSRLIEEARAAERAAAEYHRLAVATQQPQANKSARESAAVFQASAREQIASEKAIATAANATELAIVRQGNAYAGAAEKARNLAGRIERSGLSYEKQGALTGPIETARATLQGQLSPSKALGVAELATAKNQYNATLGQISRNFQDVLSKSQPLPEAMERWRNSLRGLGSSALLLNGHLGGMSTRFFALSQIVNTSGLAFGAAAAGIATFTLGFVSLAKASVETELQLSKARQTLTAVTGSALGAAGALAAVRGIADQAGQSFASSAQSYARFAAGAKAAGQSTERIQDEFKKVSLAAGTLNLSVEDSEGVFRALEQMLSKGTVQAEELRGQLGDRMPGAFAIAAQAMGKTTSELGKMMKAGDLVTKDFLPKFVDQLLKVYNIDPSKSINTLQASLNRLGTSQTFFFDAFNKQTQVTQLFKDIVDTAAQSLNFLTENMSKVFEVVAGLTGAFIGLSAAIFVLANITAVTAAIAAFGGWVASVAALLPTVTTLTEAWTLAQASLNIAMLANPVGALIGLLVKLAVVIGAAYFGYQLFSGIITQSNASLSNISGIQAQIDGQIKLGFQIRQTTAEMARQIGVAARQAAVNLRAAGSAYGNSIEDASSARQAANATKGGGALDVVNRISHPFLEQRAKAANDNMATAKKNYDRQMRDASDIQRAASSLGTVVKLPTLGDSDASGGGSAGKGKKGKTPKGANDNIDSIKNLIDEASGAMLQLNKLAEGPADVKLVDDLQKAKDVLRGLSDSELKKADAALIAAGYSTGTLETRLAALATAARTTKEQVQAFGQVWEKVDREAIDQQGIKKQLEFLAGGGSFRQLFVVDALTAAEDALRKIKEPKALEAIRLRLVAMGFAGDTAAQALANMFSQSDKAKNLLNVVQEMQKALENSTQATGNANILTAAFGKGAEVGDAAKRFLAIKERLDAYRDSLEATGATATDVEAAVSAMNTVFLNQDAAETLAKKAEEAANRYREAWKATSSDVVQAISDIAFQAKNVEQAITDLFTNFAKRLLETKLTEVLDGVLGSLTGRGAKADTAAAGIVKQTAATASSVTAIVAMTTAASAAAAALARLAISGGGSVAASGGGILGAIFNGILGAAGKAAGKGIDITPASVAAGNAAVNVPIVGGRAAGGPMTAGFSYRVGEPGVGTEIFTPSVSGHLTPAAGLGGGGQTVHIDASTTIDARGATPDAVAELKVWAARRDADLRAKLPSMIDNRVADSKLRGRG